MSQNQTTNQTASKAPNTRSNWVVLKFGGTSVSTLSNWNSIEGVVRKQIKEGLKPVVICSALSGISNLLEKLIEGAKRGEQQPILDEIFKRHRDLAAGLDISNQDIFFDGFDQLSRLTHGIFLIGSSNPSLQARILAQGEILSTKLGQAFLESKGLNSQWKDARTLLTVIREPQEQEARKFLSATCEYSFDPEFGKKFEKDKADVYITQGFIAQNHIGETVLLGRGGSDTSASYMAAKLNAARLEIWTNVPGIFTANPHQIGSARLLLNLDYDEAQELATSGAKVLHPRSIDPVRQAKVPLHIKWTEKPDHPGTVIGKHGNSIGPSVKAVSTKSGIQIISMDSIQMWQQAGFLADVFNCFKKFGVSIDLIATSETNVTVTLDRSANVIDDNTLDGLLNELKKFCTPNSFGPCSAVSLVGKNIRAILHQLAPAFSAFEDKRIYLVSQAASDLNFTFVVEEKEANRLIGTLHSLFFSDLGKQKLFGPQWNEIHLGKKAQVRTVALPWWHAKKESLIKLAQKETPLYVYDIETMNERADQLKQLKSISEFHYAVKANSHPEILRSFDAKGLKFDCVSTEEIDHVIECIPGIAVDKILFTPNFASTKEYEYALKKNCIVTLDNVHPLEHHPKMFKGAKILVRVDSGIAKGHHPHVMTSGPKSKFGVSHEELDRVKMLAKDAGATIIGLHAHVGSGILTAETWAETAGFLADVASSIDSIEILDLGGGLGIVEKPGQSPLDINAVEQHLRNFKDQHPKFELWMEPGRYLVAEGGVLLAAVTQLKKKSGKNFVGLDAGMNSLIRPSLYGAWHQISNLTNLDKPTALTADIVGPICETGDVIGHGRKLPETKEGDICLIATAGAYGRVMASAYNLRQPANEVILRE